MTDESVDQVQVAVVALELDTTIPLLEAELGDNVFRDAAGFRVCTPGRAAALIAAHEERQEDAAESSKRRAEAARAAAAEQRRVGIARGQAARAAAAAGESKITKMRITGSTEFPGLDALPHATGAMLADAPAEFEGGTSTPRPSRLDWLTGAAEGGGLFGPPPRRRKDAE